MPGNLPDKILAVDNDEGVLNTITRCLEPHQIQVVTAKDWESALYQFNHNKLDLCIVSLDLEDMPGTTLIQKWRNHDNPIKRNVAFILSSGLKRTANDEALLKELGDIILIQKPIRAQALIIAITKAYQLVLEKTRLAEIQNKLIEPLLNQQKYDKAVQVACEKLEPLGEWGLFESAKIHHMAEKNAEAQEKLRSLIALDPKNMSYHNELARIYLVQGDLEAAQRAYETADRIAPHNLQRLDEMAELYMQMKLPGKSIEKFKEIIELSPDDPEAKYSMYEKLYNAGFTTEAQEFCRETSTPKELVRHFNNKGVMLSKVSQHIKAIEEYSKALKYIPGAKELYRVLYNMAISHINLKSLDHLQRAHQLLQECLKLEPNFTKAQEKLKITSKYAGLAPSEKLEE